MIRPIGNSDVFISTSLCVRNFDEPKNIARVTIHHCLFLSNSRRSMPFYGMVIPVSWLVLWTCFRNVSEQKKTASSLLKPAMLGTNGYKIIFSNHINLMPNTHRRRRRGETVESRRRCEHTRRQSWASLQFSVLTTDKWRQVTTSGPLTGKPCPPLSLGGESLTWVQSIKYLGVHIVSARRLTFDINPIKRAFFVARNTICCQSSGMGEILQLSLLESYCLPIFYSSRATFLT